MNLPARLPVLQRDPTKKPSWRDEARHAVTDLAGLEARLRLTASEREGVQRALAQGLPLSITPYYLSLCSPDDPRCPIRLQCVPQSLEAVEVPGDLRDPLGEEAHEVVPNLVQRYPDRALLLATDRCSVYCRFCTRARMVGQDGGARSDERLRPAMDYLRAHPEVRDVIVSGGDPLVMSTERLARVLAMVREVPSVETIRLATRAPVVLPSRITLGLCKRLRRFAPLWVMTHFNHPRELTERSRRACERLVDHGIPVMNQTVLLRGVNDSADTLEALFRGLVRVRVRPYYLLQTDPIRGTGHLRTPLATGIDIMERLQGRLSGIALPKLIVDTPDGKGKVPVGPNYVLSHAPGRTTLRTFRNEVVDYIDPPHTPVR